MLPLTSMLRYAAVTTVLLADMASAATSIIPTNNTISDTSTLVNLTVTAGSRTLPQINVLPLSPGARDVQVCRLFSSSILAYQLIVQSSPQRGDVFLATTNNFLSITPSKVVFISCDNATTNIDAFTLYGQAASMNPAAIIFYSATANWCVPQPINSLNYHYVYTMTDLNDTAILLYGVMNRAISSTAILGGRNSSDPGDTSTSPAPGTALAMIILYAITGTITALFILIIITGTIRAHRHPERYGPSTIAGRPKRTRAGGLARAMLDTLPVVKFGERSAPKQDDVELTANTSYAPDQAAQQGGTIKGPAMTTTAETEGGIAAASSSVDQSADTQGCSICTEDFEIGQDQRVLPCDHCFHPACVDPWLLNVSGTCPLCRVDLRPPEEDAATAGSDTDTAIRPAAARRRSVLMAITGLRRPDGMSREERVQALRQYRMARQSEDVQAEAGADIQTADTVNEGPTRRRISQLFNVRTRRAAPQS